MRKKCKGRNSAVNKKRKSNASKSKSAKISTNDGCPKECSEHKHSIKYKRKSPLNHKIQTNQLSEIINDERDETDQTDSEAASSTSSKIVFDSVNEQDMVGQIDKPEMNNVTKEKESDKAINTKQSYISEWLQYFKNKFKQAEEVPDKLSDEEIIERDKLLANVIYRLRCKMKKEEEEEKKKKEEEEEEEDERDELQAKDKKIQDKMLAKKGSAANEESEKVYDIYLDEIEIPLWILMIILNSLLVLILSFIDYSE